MLTRTQHTELKAYLDANSGTYGALTNQEAADTLNTESVTRVRSAMSGSELFAETDTTEYNALTADERQEWLGLCGLESVDPRNAGTAAPIVTRIFGNPSSTRTALLAARDENVSPATEQGWPRVREDDVRIARSLP